MAPPTAAFSAPSCPKLAQPSGFSGLRSKHLILERCSLGYKPSIVAYKSSLQANLRASGNINARGFLSSSAAQHKQLAALSSQFLGEEKGGLWHVNHFLLRHDQKSPFSARAYKDEIFKIKYPVITEKPEWWWRTLACVPYLIALQISDTGYFLQPFLERFEMFGNLVFFVPGAIKRLPAWFSMIYCYFGYLGIVKNKDWPHFLRFHMMMGMLLETGLQLLWYTSNFFPLIHFKGRFGMYFWAGVAFSYIITVLECVRCALSGKYSHIPFVSDAAYIHTLFNIGSFQRPF